jgi:hypothetical protein
MPPSDQLSSTVVAAAENILTNSTNYNQIVYKPADM